MNARMRKRPANIDKGIQNQSEIDFTKYKLIQMAVMGPSVLTICQVARSASGFGIQRPVFSTQLQFYVYAILNFHFPS